MTVDTAPDATEVLNPLYEEILDAGFGDEVPLNWFTSQSSRPDILRSTWALTKGILVEGQLPGALKQMICLAVSGRNDCNYCQVVHTNVLAALGVSDDAIQACVADPDFSSLPPVQRAVLHFATKAARSPNDIDDEDRQSLRDVGLTDGEIIEVCMLAAFTNFINTWADAAGVPLD